MTITSSSKFKYSFEAELRVVNTENILLPVSNLKEFKKEDLENENLDDFHIYAILSSPKLYFDAESIEYTKTELKVKLFSIVDGKKKEYVSKIPINSFPYEYVNVECIYPGERIIITLSNSEVIDLSAQQFFSLYMPLYVNNFNLEIMYIGQSYGRKVEKSAIERLQEHSTLQEILADCQSKYNDRLIYIMLIGVEAQLGMGFLGKDSDSIKSPEQSRKHMEDIVSSEPTERQIVNITEAALIHYFKPEYNVNFKENFPLKSQKSLSYYYELDYNAFRFSFDRIEFNGVNTEIYTDTHSFPGPYRTINYKLDNNPTRKTMYEIFK